MHIKEGDRVRILGADINEDNEWRNKRGKVEWTDGYMYDVLLEDTGDKITVYWNDLKKIK